MGSAEKNKKKNLKIIQGKIVIQILTVVIGGLADDDSFLWWLIDEL